MNIKKTDILKNIYDELLEIKGEEDEIVQKNLNRVKEIDLFLNSLKEDSDFSVFSPRSSEVIYADKIEKLKSEKSVIENENNIHYHKLNQLNKQITQLEQLFISDTVEKYDDKKVLEMQEKDRQRIARELHDSSVQNLTHLIHMIELSSMYIDKDSIRAKLELEQCIKILKSTVNEIREIIFNFRPMSFDDLGLEQCIENFISSCQSKFKNCKIEYHICDLPLDVWKNKDKQEINFLLLTIYRIIQESVNNALKHSNGDRIVLDIGTKNNKCYINIKDNGKGFSVEDVLEQENMHFGISIMKERINLLHGTILFNTDKEKGTEINIEIPLANEER